MFATVFLVSLASLFARASSTPPPKPTPPYLPLRPYPFLNNLSRPVPLPGSEYSPDPLVNAIWPNDTRQDEFQCMYVYPKSVHTTTPNSFVGLDRLIRSSSSSSEQNSNETAAPVVVLGSGMFRVDFGVESAGWLEIVSDDMPLSAFMNLTLSLSEDLVMYPGKILRPKSYPNGVYRIETNPDIYEGIRFGFINIIYNEGIHWHIKEVRAVAQTLPVPYRGSFVLHDDHELSKIWYTAALCPKLNMATQPLSGMVAPSQFMLNAILMDRGDRIGWTGDDHVGQMAIMKAFGQYEFVRQNLWNTHNDSASGQTRQGIIRTYELYWCLSVFDYYIESGDKKTVISYISNIEARLKYALQVEGSSVAWGMTGVHWSSPPQLAFVGWDERLGSGFENGSCIEAQRVYSMLTLRTCQSFVTVLKSLPSTSGSYNALIGKYETAATNIIHNIKSQLGENSWYQTQFFGLHSISEALNSLNFTTAKDRANIYTLYFENNTAQICSFSSFNQFFLLKGIGSIEGRLGEAIEIARLCWGGQNQIGGTTYFETFSPTWLDVFKPNERLPAFNNGRTSLCHPWASGVLTWLSENVLGVQPQLPGYRSWIFFPKRFASIEGTVPTPFHGDNDGNIYIKLDIQARELRVTVPDGTRGSLSVPLFLAHATAGINGGVCNGASSKERVVPAVLINGQVVTEFTLVQHLYDAVVTSSSKEELSIELEQRKEQNEESGRSSSSSFYACYLTLTNELEHGEYTISWDLPASALIRTVPLAVAPLPAPVYNAKFLGLDRTTNGTVWHDFYGKDGFVLFSPLETGKNIISLPNYISNYSTKVWEDRYPEGTFVGKKNATSCALKIPNQANYGLGTILNYDEKNNLNSYIDFLFDRHLLKSSTEEVEVRISLYLCDWPAPTVTLDTNWSRKVGVVAFDRETMNTIAPITIVSEFQGGVWMSWTYHTSLRFRIVSVLGNGPTLSAVAFN